MVAALWALGAVLALVQMGRLSAFMDDPERIWGSVVPDPEHGRQRGASGNGCADASGMQDTTACSAALQT